MTTTFSVIGIMKCGTTTVHHDLARTGTVDLAPKESQRFLDPDLAVHPTPRPVGDCSTRYTLGDGAAVAQQLRRRVGPDHRIVALVREPVERALSHHHHLLARGTTSLPFDRAIERFPEIVELGRYDAVLQPWHEVFGADAVLVVPLERYRCDDGRSLGAIVEHIGATAPTALSTGHSNATEEARVFTGLGRRLVESRVGRTVYQSSAHRRIPAPVRRLARRALIPPPPPRPPAPPEELFVELDERFAAARRFVEHHAGWTYATQGGHVG